MRIVSLLPSATEIICALGLENQLVGVTHECDYPPFVLDLPKVTRTLIPHDAPSREIDALVRERMKTQRALYSLDLPTLERLQPDLIVTQALCDVCAVAEEEVTAAACTLPGRPKVLNLEPTNLSEVFATLLQVARAVGIDSQGERIVGELRQRVDAVAAQSKTLTSRPRVVLLEWIDPPFSCGHWSPEIVELAGGQEMLGRPGERSRGLSWEEIAAVRPEVLFIACCGFSVERTQLDLPLLRNVGAKRIYIVDGSAYFSRPGPRLVDSLEILAHALHPQLSPPCALRIAVNPTEG